MSQQADDFHLFQGEMNVTKRLITYPAAERNKGPLLDVIKKILSSLKLDDGNRKLEALEIGSGTGQHVAHFASALPYINFQPSDLTDELFANIAGFREQLGLANIRDPVRIDLMQSAEEWKDVPTGHYDLMVCSNVLHISPLQTSTGLFAGASRCLKPMCGNLVIYGPFAVDGIITPESNVQFDLSLKARNAEWGIRDTRMLNRLANSHGLTLKQIIDMPANNKVLHYCFG